jgi:hypothetical protein
MSTVVNQVLKIDVDILHAEYVTHMVNFSVTDASGNVRFFLVSW